MKKLYISTIGFCIGWLLLGPPGAVGGNIIANTIYTSIKKYFMTPKAKFKKAIGELGVSMILLSAAIIRSNKKASRKEFIYVKSYLLKEFGDQVGGIGYEYLSKAVKEKIILKNICQSVAFNTDSNERKQIIKYLFQIARADGFVSTSEINTITKVASLLDIDPNDFEKIKDYYTKEEQQKTYSYYTSSSTSLTESYKVLGINKSISNAALKKRYWTLAKKYHPDMVLYKGEEHRKAAKEKFQKIVEAYEIIKNHRGIA